MNLPIDKQPAQDRLEDFVNDFAAANQLVEEANHGSKEKKKLTWKQRIKILVWVLVVCIALDGILLGVTSIFSNHDKYWGVTLDVSDVSPEGMKLSVTRERGSSNETLLMSPDFILQKRHLFGWHNVKSKENIVFVSASGIVDEGYEKSGEMQFEKVFGKLLPGIYRYGKEFEAEDIRSYSEENVRKKHLRFTLYKTFIVLF